MGEPAAKQGDTITATDTHLVLPTGATNPVTAELPFSGVIDGGISSNVKIMSMPAAVVGTTAENDPPHIPPPGSTFVDPPSNSATIVAGSETVFINKKPAARNGDTATTCNDPVELPVGTVAAEGTVLIG